MVSGTMSIAPGIDFTPHLSVRELDGARFSELVFADGLWDVSYEPPVHWNYRGEGNVLVLWPENKGQADAKVIVSKAGAAPVALDAPGMKSLRSRAEALLPRGTQEVEFLSETKNAVTISGHETYEATFEYALFGQKFRTCVLFAFLGDRVMTVQVSAHPDDFPAVYQAFHSSLFSFHWRKAI